MYYQWSPYVPVAEKRRKAKARMEKMQKAGKKIYPVEFEGRTIAHSFWGKGWCTHLESFSDYENRLPRGRAYVRNGSVCHLEIFPQRIEAFVAGSQLYVVNVSIAKLPENKWEMMKKKCSGRVGSILELLQGKLSDEVMAVVADRKTGLFPLPKEIEMKCSCPDWAGMCKHVAAVLYGIGNRLDSNPELLFRLRGVDAGELVADGMHLPRSDKTASDDSLSESSLEDIFGVEIDSKNSLKSAKIKSVSGKKKKIVALEKAVSENGAVTAGNRPRKVASATKRKSIVIADNGGKRRATAVRIAAKNFVPTGLSIRKMRKQCGCSVAEFAERVSTSVQTIYNWEKTKGRVGVSSENLKTLKTLFSSLSLKKK